MKDRRHLQSGGVLLIVLVIILVAGVVTAGWVTIMTAEMAYAEQFSAGSQRRIALGNATALARQYLLASVLTKNSSVAANADAGGGWGSVAIPATVAPALSTFQKAAGYNHFNPGNGDGYTEDITVAMTAGTGTGAVNINRLLQIKSRSSLLSGTLAVLNQPGNSVAGNFIANGQTLLWAPQGTYSMTSNSYIAPSQPSAATILPSNFPFTPLTGSEVAGAPAYNGSLNVVANLSTINSLAVMAITSAPDGVQNIVGTTPSNASGVVCDGAGHLTINLLDPTLGNVVVTGGVTQLTLTGQTSAADLTAADNAAAILILVNQITPATDLTSVICQNSNNRKLVLAIKTASGHATTFTFPQAASGNWRSLITLENTPVTFQFSGTQPLYGGIQSDHAITVAAGGSLSLFPETSPKLLERLADRDGWIEAYTP